MRNKIFKTIIALLIAVVIGVISIEYFVGNHNFRFKHGELSFNMEADECTICFLDWQIDYEIDIKDLHNDKNYKFSFFSGNGPENNILRSLRYPHLILIEGYGHSYGSFWLIDLESSSIRQTSVDKNIRESFEVIYRVDHNLQGMTISQK